MATPMLMVDGPSDPEHLFVFAHGAGAPMDSPFMQSFAERLAREGVRVVRFEFPYMAARRTGAKRPPDKFDVLSKAFEEVVSLQGGGARVVIGGKSMGGRIATMIAERIEARGVACLGYPFHPPGEPDRLRIEHLPTLKRPLLIVQGTRDPLGGIDEVLGYGLKARIEWIEDGDHDLVPRKKSGRTREQNWEEAAQHLLGFLNRLE